MSIEGIPNGWKLVRVGKCYTGEVRVDTEGKPAEWLQPPSMSANYVIIEPIKDSKRYRPFANAAEFLAHHLSGDFIDVGAGEFAKVQHCDSEGVWFSDDHEAQFYEDALVDFKFRDGTPFGVEVTE